jgi:glycosyltransferase involved in cell wall biosynthesis
VADRGIDVRLLTSKPQGVLHSSRAGRMPVRYVRLPPLPSDNLAFAAVSLPFVAASSVDLVHAWHYGDGWAAVQARRLHPRRPVVLKLTGTVEASRMQHVRFDRRLFREAIEGADEVWCNSRYAADVMAGFGVPMHVVPAGVDVDRFRPLAPGAARLDPPVVLCASAPDDPRKRLVDVVDAWPAILDAMPEARLVLAGRGSADLRRQLLGRIPPAAATSVEIVGDLADGDLVRAYTTATVVVAPGVHEALGLSTLEALACGTPVAGARSGATVELVDDGLTGALFEPGDPTSCADAVVRAAALTSLGDTSKACRAASAPYAWDEIVQTVESRWHALVQV